MAQYDEILQRLATLEERSQQQVKLQDELKVKIDEYIESFEKNYKDVSETISKLKTKIAIISIGSSGAIGTLASIIVQLIKGGH